MPPAVAGRFPAACLLVNTAYLRRAAICARRRAIAAVDAAPMLAGPQLHGTALASVDVFHRTSATASVQPHLLNILARL
jgi:hypothetical protein